VSVTVRQAAEWIQGQVRGDGETVITSARTLADAQPGDITFVENAKHVPELARSKAAAAVVPAGVTVADRPVIEVQDPLGAFVVIYQHLHARPEAERQGINPHSSVHPSAKIGANPSIYSFASIGEGTLIGAHCTIHPGAVVGCHCRIGDDVTLHANAVLYDGTVLGNRVTIHANAVIGADGFGYRFQEGRHVKVPQMGYVEIGDDVEIGACTTIDRGTFGPTRVEAGTKIDNLVQIGHNCRIGKHNLLVSQMGIAGSSSTGDYVVVAGQVGIVDHVHIGDRAILGAGSGVPNDVPAGECVLGSPARPIRDQKRILITLDKLPEMRKDLQRIKQQLGMKDENKLAG